ncbi:hypothetical protein HHK36_018954 [Tetracentron sinense]|uniref:Uncharacterized protein n=1 Tax=Tetracentron sinense TaxID=13715 RepID=A0A834YVE9_TETSI|nr:hypothetical protein HHK36_018954 [Tetracentron sinense]
MEATELQHFEGQFTPNEEGRLENGHRKRGGWITFPFITGCVMGLTLATGGWISNLIVYLIREFNVKSIDAAQISNIVSGCTSLFPFAGAIMADSFFGCSSVIIVSSFLSMLGMIMFTLTATIHSLRPPPCTNGLSTCEAPSKFQFAVLYIIIALAAIGSGGTRFTVATLGADQFDKPKDQAIFFNWYFFILYVSSIISSTAIVYVQDNVGWGLGFGLGIGANAIGLAMFLLGIRHYRRVKPQGSPFMSLAQVVVATIRKRKVFVSPGGEVYYYERNGVTKLPCPTPTSSFRFLNRAALKTQGDTEIGSNGSIARPWRLCTVEQVEDLKTLIRIFPLWSASIFLSTPIGIQASLTILQALNMDRHLGPHFQIPAGSILVFTLVSTAISLSIIDRFLCPMWQKVTRRSPTPLQRVGLGHVLNVIGMAGSALVESRRLRIVRSHHLTGQPGSIVPMSALWLMLPLAIVGVGEAFHFPGQVAFYYQEFPTSLRTTATAMISLLIGIGFYMSTAVIDLVRRVTGWLPDNINDGRLDNVFWMLVVIGVINFGYYLTCARLYKHQSVDQKDDTKSASDG